jgi:hypothetical protein
MCAHGGWVPSGCQALCVARTWGYLRLTFEGTTRRVCVRPPGGGGTAGRAPMPPALALRAGARVCFCGGSAGLFLWLLSSCSCHMRCRWPLVCCGLGALVKKKGGGGGQMAVETLRVGHTRAPAPGPTAAGARSPAAFAHAWRIASRFIAWPGGRRCGSKWPKPIPSAKRAGVS